VTLACTATASASWTYNGGGWYEETGNGTKELWEKGKLIKSWTAEEWRAWEERVNSYAKVMGEHDATFESMVKDMVGHQGGGAATQGEVEDAASVLTKARDEGGNLGKDLSEKFLLAGEEGGSLSAADAAAFLGPAVGALFFGPTAFHLGVDIGNELDQLLGLPKWEDYEKEEAAKHGLSGPTAQWVESECVGSGVQCEKSRVHKPGIILACYSQDTGYRQTKTNAPELGKTTFLGCAEQGDHLGPVEEKFGFPVEERYAFEAWVYYICLQSTFVPGEKLGSKCHVINANEPLYPEGIPKQGPLTPTQEKNNKEAGIEEKPKTEIAKKSTTTRLSSKQVEKMEGGPNVVPGPVTIPQLEEEKSHHTAKAGEGSAPLPHFEEQNSPHESEYPKEVPAEPVTPPASPPIVPAIKWPHVETPCNRFPFGIPCWLVARLVEFGTTQKTPKFEVKLDGATMKINFGEADELMEIVRAVELVLGTIGAVLLFGRFASSSTGSSGGGE
jgi:hypothetical protein